MDKRGTTEKMDRSDKIYRADKIDSIIKVVDIEKHQDDDHLREMKRLEQVKSLYFDSFPRILLDKWDAILDYLHENSPSRKNPSKISVLLVSLENKDVGDVSAWSANVITGFLLFTYIVESKLVFLDYIAIKPEFRNQGIGSALINAVPGIVQNWSEIQDTDKPAINAIIGEIERADIDYGKGHDTNIVKKRNRFYNRLSFQKINIPYFQPKFSPYAEIVRLNLIIRPYQCEPPYSKYEIKKLYKIMYREYYELNKDQMDEVMRYMDQSEWPAIIQTSSL